MKRAFLSITLTLMSLLSFGQDNSVLKFMGIPIDGSETQFAAQLKSKGFTYSPASEGYKGQFNGKPVDVYIHTNHNVVDRVYVAFPITTEESIRNEFNILLGQFNDNGKYLDLSMNQMIPEDEDISYEITVHNKRYQASFCYFAPDGDYLEKGNTLLDKFSGLLSDEVIIKLKNSIKEGNLLSEADQNRLAEELQNSIGVADEDKALLVMTTLINGIKSIADGDVWFMIHERYGRYQIGLYYDNLHNQAHGEDL